MNEKTANVNRDDENRRAWRKPAVTRIEIKRTLVKPGSSADGGSTPTA
jgi:hypothetical protein